MLWHWFQLDSVNTGVTGYVVCVCFKKWFHLSPPILWFSWSLDIETSWRVVQICTLWYRNIDLRCSCHYFLDIILFHHDFIMIVVNIIGNFMANNYLLIYTLGFLYISSSGSANAQLPGCFRPGHSPWILDWTCFIWTPSCHVYIPF